MHRLVRGAIAGSALLVLSLEYALAGIPKGWVRQEGPQFRGTIELDRSVRHGGRASAAIHTAEAKGADQRYSMSLVQWIRADRYRDKRVRLSAYLKTSGVGTLEQEGAGITFFPWSLYNRLTGAASPRDRRVTGTTRWRRYEQVIDVPREAVLLRIAVVLYGRGQIWVDDMKLEVVGTHVPTTGRSYAREGTDESYLDVMPKLLKTAPLQPVNLDFER